MIDGLNAAGRGKIVVFSHVQKQLRRYFFRFRVHHFLSFRFRLQCSRFTTVLRPSTSGEHKTRLRLVALRMRRDNDGLPLSPRDSCVTKLPTFTNYAKWCRLPESNVTTLYDPDIAPCGPRKPTGVADSQLDGLTRLQYRHLRVTRCRRRPSVDVPARPCLPRQINAVFRPSVIRL